jgi:C4-dicarboxylate-specific signal transduction histidine kinase
MRLLKDHSIKTKLGLLAFVAAGVALSLSTGAFVVNDVRMLRASKVQQLSALAKVLGANSTAALTFDDNSAAQEVLASLTMQPTVKDGCLFDAKGRVFATYPSAYHPGAFPAAPPPEGHCFTGDHLEVSQEILRENARVGTVYIRASMDDLWAQVLRCAAIVAVVLPASLAAAMALSRRLQRLVSGPVLQLARTAQQISCAGDYSVRVRKQSGDELGVLYDEFNAMLERIQQGERQLQVAHDELEQRVEERTLQLSVANGELSREIAERRRAESQLAEVHHQLVDAARRAGMAEIATGVLHNVGNVLNSVNVSATVVADRLRNAKIADLQRGVELLEQHAGELAQFLTQDKRGTQLPGFLRLMTQHLTRNREVMLGELQSLTRHIDHIKTIVAMQQSFTGVAGVIEAASLAELFEDAIKLNAPSLQKYHVEVLREYDDLPEVRVDRQKVMQILVNLVTNAKDALLETGEARRRITAAIRLAETDGEAKVRIEVRDNGAGIAPENLVRIFSHGFTTKKHGHGFGLHSSANAAKELGGALAARSDGPGRGAVFTLELPFRPVEVLA